MRPSINSASLCSVLCRRFDTAVKTDVVGDSLGVDFVAAPSVLGVRAGGVA